MKFSPQLFAGTATGAYLTGSSTDHSDPFATFLGGVVGGAVGSNFDLSLPRGTLNPINTRVNIKNSFNNPRDLRASMLAEITDGLRSRSANSTFSGDFSVTQPFSTINSNNVDAAITGYNDMSNSDLQRSYLNFKNNRNVFVGIHDSTGMNAFNSFTPSRAMVTEKATLAERQNSMYSYLMNVAGEDAEFARQRVDELTPFLGKLESSMTISDGVLSTKAFGENMKISLTQTLGDGVTTGYVSNNNAYLAGTYNLTGGLIANQQEGFEAIAKSMGIVEDSPGGRALQEMLGRHGGVTKEGALGFLSSLNLSDSAMAAAVKGLEENKQWDEFSTSELLKKRIADINGTSYEREVSEYAKHVSNLVDFSKTVRYDNSANQIVEKNGEALRNVGTVSRGTGELSELTKLRRNIVGDGIDRFSQVKADANLKLTGLNHTTDSPSHFLAYNRNANTVNRRALQAPTNNRANSLDQAFDSFKNVFKGNSTLSSAVALRSETFDMEKIGDTLSRTLGGNVTLADGYSIANSQRLSRFSATGVRKVSIPSDSQNNVAIKNPLVEKLMRGDTTMSELQHRAGGFESLVKFNTSLNQEKVFGEIVSNMKGIQGSANYTDAVAFLTNNTTDRFEGAVDHAISAVEKYQKELGLDADDPRLHLRLQDSYLETMGKKIAMRRKHIDLSGEKGFASAVIDDYNSKIDDVVFRLDVGRFDEAEESFKNAITDFNNNRSDAISSHRMMNGIGGQTVGYGLEGESVKLPDAYTKYKLLGIQTSLDSAGKGTLDMIYEGTLGLDENYVGKGFGINSKEQFLLAQRDTFGKAGVIGTMIDRKLIQDTGSGIIVNKGATSSGEELRLSYEDFNKSINDTSQYNAHTSSMIKSTYVDFSRNVDMISDHNNAGYKAEAMIRDSLKAKANTSDVLSDTVWKSLREYQDKNAVDKKGLAGLVNYGLATTNEKASLATLANVFMRNEERFSKLQTAFNSNKININKAVAQFQKIDPTFKPNSVISTQVFADMRSSLDNMQATLAERFNDRSGVYAMLADNNQRTSAIDFFVRSAKFTSDIKTSKISISSLNRTAISETGAGTTGKSMSWNAQLQLLSGGYSYDDLDAFAKFDKSSYNDLQAISGMIDTHKNSINEHFDYSKNTQFKNAFNATPGDRRDMFKKLGVNTGNDVDFYNLSYTPEGSFKAMPIIYDETRLFDSFTSTKTGVETNRRATSLMYDIIKSDMELQATTDESVKASIRGELDTLHNRLQGHINPALSGSTSAGKAALTRSGSSSLQSTVGAINGDMTSFLADEKSAGRHTSFVAVSQEGAMKRLQLSGIDVADLEAMNKHHLERIGKTSLYRLKLQDGNPFFGIVNREPATGPMSARLAEYVVDMSIKGKGSENSLFIKSEDPIYKLFQFGDYDFDNTTEYFMDDMNNKSAEQRAAILAKGQKVAREYSALEDFAQGLGVKNNKTDKMASLFDVFEQNKAKIKTEEDWHNAYLSHLNDTSKQSGLRKIVSPQVTMLSAALNNSLMKVSDDSDQGVKAARVLTHYFVENLLKAQHAEAGGSVNTVAENLSNLRTNALKQGGSQREYLDKLKDSLTDMIQKHKGTSSYDMGMDAITRIVDAESINMTSNPVNSMELGGAGLGKRFDQRIENLRNMIDGNDQAIPLFRREADEVDVAKTAKVGYDRFKNVTKQFYQKNKKTLALGAAGLGGVALAFQHKPTNEVTADVGRQTLAPSTMTDQESSRSMTGGRDFNRSSEYITPHRDARKSVTVEGQYVNDSDNYREDSRQSVFGDNVNSAQIEYRE